MQSRNNYSGLLNLEEEGSTVPQNIGNHSPSDTITFQKILIFFPRHVCVVYCNYEPYPVILYVVYCNCEPYLVIFFVSVVARLVLENVEREEEDGEDDSVVCNGTSVIGVDTDHNTNGELDSG
jgi:hypothetical protein